VAYLTPQGSTGNTVNALNQDVALGLVSWANAEDTKKMAAQIIKLM
jgi:hypothetical protein